MVTESLFWATLQSSFIIALIHGTNPCGNSWLVLAPFVMAEKSGRSVFLLTLSFLGGTPLACVLLGASLGTVSAFLPETPVSG